MEEEILKKLWSDQAGNIQIDINSKKLIESMNQKMNNFEKQIRRRDFLEIGVALLMVPLFSYYFYRDSNPMVKLGAAIIIATNFVVVYKLLEAKRAKHVVDPGSPVAGQLSISLLRVERQIRLLKSVLWWYLLPFFVGVVFLLLGSVGILWIRILFILLIAVLYGYIYYLNMKALREKLVPFEKSIRRTLDQINANPVQVTTVI